MSAMERDLLLVATGLILVFRIYFLRRWRWHFPMSHGQGFFLGNEVPPGFYGGHGIRWVNRYHFVLLSESLIEWIALAAIIGLRRWDLLPAWAGGIAVLSVTAHHGFVAWARRALGGSRRTMSALAVSLETRRFSDYATWPMEILIDVILALSWLLILTRGNAAIRWLDPVTPTYVILGLLAGKALVARSRVRLPAERTEEHHRWSEGSRSHWVRIWDIFRLLVATQLAAYALQFWPPAKSAPWLRWFFVGIVFAIWLFLAGILVRDTRRLSAMGRDLRPPDSWTGPFQARWSSRGTLVWMIAFTAGLFLLLGFYYI